MGFPIERYCFRNGCRWLLICLILGHYRWDGNQWGPVGFWVNKHFLRWQQIESAEAVWTEGGILKKNNNILLLTLFIGGVQEIVSALTVD